MTRRQLRQGHERSGTAAGVPMWPLQTALVDASKIPNDESDDRIWRRGEAPLSGGREPDSCQTLNLTPRRPQKAANRRARGHSLDTTYPLTPQVDRFAEPIELAAPANPLAAARYSC